LDAAGPIGAIGVLDQAEVSHKKFDFAVLFPLCLNIVIIDPLLLFISPLFLLETGWLLKHGIGRIYHVACLPVYGFDERKGVE